MKTLYLRDGDLVPMHRDLAQIDGSGKVAQDLRGALLEPMGNDRFHPGWGSVIGDFIATIIDEDTRLDVEAEINRVISNYAAVQRDKIEADISGNAETRFTTNEVLQRIQSVSADTSGDTVKVHIRLQTVAGDVVMLDEAVA